jgi:hypothetical protein
MDQKTRTRAGRKARAGGVSAAAVCDASGQHTVERLDAVLSGKKRGARRPSRQASQGGRREDGGPLTRRSAGRSGAKGVAVVGGEGDWVGRGGGGAGRHLFRSRVCPAFQGQFI